MDTDRSEGQDVGTLIRGCYCQILEADKDLKVLKAASAKVVHQPLRFSGHARLLLGLTGPVPVWRDHIKENQTQVATPNSGNKRGGRGGGRGGGGRGGKREGSSHQGNNENW